MEGVKAGRIASIALEIDGASGVYAGDSVAFEGEKIKLLTGHHTVTFPKKPVEIPIAGVFRSFSLKVIYLKDSTNLTKPSLSAFETEKFLLTIQKTLTDIKLLAAGCMCATVFLAFLLN